MALRHLTRNRLLTAQMNIRMLSVHAPTVFDKMVQVSVTDLVGRRHILRGLEGQSLVDIIFEHQDELQGGGEILALSAEGRGEKEAHVSIANEFLDVIPEPKGDDIFALQQLAPVHTTNSRLASKIMMTKQLNNLSIALGEINPWRTL